MIMKFYFACPTALFFTPWTPRGLNISSDFIATDTPNISFNEYWLHF